MRIAISIIAAFIIIASAVFYSQYARAQNLLTPRDEFLTVISQAQD